MEELNSVQQFYAGKTIFITGASGFMGKVMLEKLLYSCSEVKEIMILMRGKKGETAKGRVEKFKSIPMFKRIMDEKPEVMNKIYPVFGEVTKHDFVMNSEHLKRVVETTQIMFHMAASLKMEAPLKPNVLINLTGTKHALALAKKMTNLIQMVHLSTAFCNVEPETVLEKIYEFHHDPDDLIRMADWMSESSMTAVQKELLGPHPNTYTYTKRLAEILVQREYGNLPICIVRPTVVLPAYREPIAGWVDSLNGVVGIFYAAGKGVLRSLLADPVGIVEYIPVDLVTNAIILIPKILSTTERAREIPIYHMTAHDTQKLPIGRLFVMIREIGRKFPMSWALWYPDGGITKNRYIHAFNVFMFQMIPAYVIDFLLFCFRQKRFLVHVQKRIADGAEVISFFTMRSWYFKSDNFFNIVKELSENEYEMFFMDCLNCKNEFKYIENCIVGGRQYCCKDPLSTLPTARVMNKIQFVLHYFFKFLFYWFVITSLLKAFGFYEPLKDYFTTQSLDLSSRS